MAAAAAPGQGACLLRITFGTQSHFRLLLLSLCLISHHSEFQDLVTSPQLVVRQLHFDSMLVLVHDHLHPRCQSVRQSTDNFEACK
jgi:hypothetical protein